MGQAVSINENILLLTDEGPRLKGAVCNDCGTHVFPAASGCSKCTGSSMSDAVLGTEGALWAWTVQGFPPKAPPYLGETDPAKFKPYGVGYVTLAGQLKVEARLTEADSKVLKSGMPMRLTTIPIAQDDDGNDIHTFAFEPV